MLKRSYSLQNIQLFVILANQKFVVHFDAVVPWIHIAEMSCASPMDAENAWACYLFFSICQTILCHGVEVKCAHSEHKGFSSQFCTIRNDSTFKVRHQETMQ